MSIHTNPSDLNLKRSSVCCRICQDGRAIEELITPCKCAGTMGYVHSSCLEKWLSRTSRTFCELCNHDFNTRVEVSSFTQWLRSVNNTVSNDRRYMLIDLTCFLLLTPLGFVSSFLCIQGSVLYYRTENFWTGFGLALLTGFLILMYFLWMGVTLRYHYLTFRKWQGNNTTVRLVFSNHRRPENILPNALGRLATLQRDEQQTPGVEIVMSIVKNDDHPENIV